MNNLSLTVSWYQYIQFKSLSHRRLVQMCTNLSLTVSWYKYVQYKSPSTGGWYKYVPNSLSQDAGKNMYKSVSHSKLVQICTNLSLTLSWYRYVQQQSLSHKKPLQIRINLSLTVSWYKLVPYKSLSLSPAAGTNMCKSLSFSKLVQI